MPSQFDVYVRRNTWLYGLDPRVKLLFVLEAALVVFLWPRLEPPLIVSAICIALLGLAHVPLHRTLSFLRSTLPFLLLVLTLTTLFGGAQQPVVWWGWGPVQVGPAGLQRALLLIARLLALGFVFFFWLSTTDQGAMTRGFVALGLPYDYGLTLALALRYVPILGGLFEQVREAQEARGLDLTAGGLAARLRAYRPVLIAVVIGALRHGERLGWALETRALGAVGIRRTTYRPLRLRRGDLAVLGGELLILAVVVGLRVL